MIWIIKMFAVMTTSTLTQCKNQMTMVVVITIMCVFTATMMFTVSNLHWFSILIMLVYTSGVMVLFMFVVSLSPNEKTSLKSNKKKLMLSLLTFMFFSKMNMQEENLKMHSCIEWSLLSLTSIFLIIFMMAYMPPKMMKSFYKGMKSSK